MRARDVDQCAQEIALGNSDLSQRTESQAAALEETAAAMDELSGTVQQNAAHAQSGLELAEESRAFTATGETQVESVRRQMDALLASAKKMTEIITVIDGIAFQTNILSLNAAIEAARAGEEGRGFAVVAKEVRGLAQKSSDSAQDIRRLIQSLEQQIKVSHSQTEEASRAMQRAGQTAATLESRMREIASASQEQAIGIQQVTQALTQMDSHTQQNAAMVEEATAATEALKSQAAALESEVARFILSRNPINRG